MIEIQISPKRTTLIDPAKVSRISGLLESKHRLSIENERIRPTPAFLRALADEMTREFGIDEPVTLGMAWQFWITVFKHLDNVRDRYQTTADVSFWYGVNAFDLRNDQREALYANLPRVKAQ